MPSTSHNLLSYLRVVVGAWRDDPRDDATLLARFAEGGDEAAFRVLICRHGPLVWQTCRRILGDTPDAEDAFQATFLALSRKAGRFTIKNPASWLHQVARRAALNADADTRRRRGLEQRLRAVRQPAVEETGRAELYAVLDEELAGLPERLRVPLVLRYLDGKTLAEVASILGCSLTGVTKRLVRGEVRLRERLERRGLVVGVVSVGALLGSTVTVSAVPARLIGSTVRAAVAFRSGVLTGGAAEAAQSVLGTLLSPLAGTIMRKGLWVVLACCLGLSGAAVVACRALSARPDEPVADGPAVPQTTERPGQDGAKQAGTDLYGDPLPPGALARMGTMRFRQHFGGVDSVCFAPDGKTLASGGGESVRLWEAATGKEIGVCQGHKLPVRSVCFSPDGKMLASGGHDGSVRLWEVATREQIRMCLAYPERGVATNHCQARCYLIESVCFSPDGKILASGGSDRVVRLWDVTTGKQIRAFPERQDVNGHIMGLCFSPDGKTLASGRGDGNVYLSEVATGKQIRMWKAVHDKEGKDVLFVTFSPDGKTLASGGPHSSPLRLWDVATGKEIRAYEEHKEVNSVSFSPDGKTLASAGRDGCVRLCEAATGKEICVWRQPLPVNSVSFSPDGKSVASGGHAGPVRLFEVATGKEILVCQGHQSGIYCVTFSPDGKTLASGGHDYTARLWDVDTSKQIGLCHEKLRRGGPLLGRDGIASVSFSPDGKTFASVTNGGTGRLANDSSVRLWEVATGKVIRTYVVDKGEWNHGSVSFSPDGKTLASGANADTPVHLWETATGKEIRRFPSSKIAGWAVAFSSDGKTLAFAGSDRAVRLWEVATGKEIHVCQEFHVADRGSITTLSFSPDNKILASGEDRGCQRADIRLWEVVTGKQIRHYRIPSEKEARNDPRFGIYSVCFSPHGQTLAVGALDGTVRLFEVATGKEIYIWRGHQGSVNSVSFSPDGKTLASASADMTILLWKVPSPPSRVVKELSAGAVQQQWTALAGEDADRAYRAIHSLAAAPRQALPLLQECLHPVAPLSAEEENRIARLIRDLDSGEFAVRQKATEELAKIETEKTILPLQQTLKGQITLEQRRRIQGLIEKAGTTNSLLPAEMLRALRSLQVLEQIGTAEAQEVLQKLARGNPGARLTQEAQASLKRLAR